MKDIEAGARDAMDFWLSQHPIMMADILEDAVKQAVQDWMEAHSDEILDKFKR
jgi:hypothetical protein